MSISGTCVWYIYLKNNLTLTNMLFVMLSNTGFCPRSIKRELTDDMSDELLELKSLVTIFSFEGSSRPFEVSNADVLTQFFTDWNSIHTSVLNQIVSDADIQLVTTPFYEKRLLKLRTLNEIEDDEDDLDDLETMGETKGIKNLKSKRSSVTFIFCHGGGRPPGYPDIPAVLNFAEQPDQNYVWACDNDCLPSSSCVTLHDLIYAADVVFLMCCHGDAILKDYILEQRNGIPDIVMFNCGEVLKVTAVILVGLLMQILDSDEGIGQNPSPKVLKEAVMRCIQTILNVVKWCDNAETFLQVLVSIGCVSTYTTEKHGLPCAFEPEHPYYRLHGQVFNVELDEDIKQGIFKDFRSLTWVTHGKTEPQYNNYQNIEDIHTPTALAIKAKILKHKEDR